jgi:undecaprenyl phosphate-alpha-L-ara4FN deformylase
MTQVNSPHIKAGLRIDVDTLRGTRLGVPSLVAELAQHNIRATFFFSVGPDNMGRHLLRLMRPAFFIKMLRSNAPNLYGWDIIFKGTLGPGPLIGQRAGTVIRAAADAGHEIGLHCWDHHHWQTKIETMNRDEIIQEMELGRAALEKICGRPIDCAAAPGWRLTDAALSAREAFSFRYLSDCRGSTIFYPVADGRVLDTPQIPVTMPTYDELIGTPGVSQETYNSCLLDLFKPGELNVLTIHAEAEGIGCRSMFAEFLEGAEKRHITFLPLGDFLDTAPISTKSAIVRGGVPGREGWVACQEEEGIGHASA